MQSQTFRRTALSLSILFCVSEFTVASSLETATRAWADITKTLSTAGYTVEVTGKTEMQLEDPAISIHHFPQDVEQGRGKIELPIAPMLDWRSRLTRKGNKTKMIERATLKELSEQDAWVSCYDGVNSWGREPKVPVVKYFPPVEQLANEDIAEAQLQMGHPKHDVFSDAIGFGSKLYHPAWSLPGQTSYAFAIDAALSSGKYKLATGHSDNESLTVLERRGLDTLWLDPNYGYALIRREWRWGMGKSLKVRVENSNFIEVDQGLWIPQTIDVHYFGTPDSAPDKLCMTCHVNVVSFQLSPVGEFVPASHKGEVLSDLTSGVDYVVPENTKSVLASFAAGKHELSRVAIHSPLLRWAVIGNIAIALLVVAVILRNKVKFAS